MPYFEFAQDFEWFRLFYLIAIATGLVLVIRAARRDALPLPTTLTLFLWVASFGVIGSKLLEVPLSAWADYFQTGSLDLGYGRTALGGMLGGMIGLAIGRRVLGVGTNVWGWFVAWPAVLALFRVGCLLVGCCIGTPSDLPWAVTYPVGSAVADGQHAHGLLAAGATCSLPAHPVPVYEILFAGLLLFAAWRLVKQGWRKEVLFFLSMGAYLGFRFLEEFIRTEHPSEGLLNPVQWGLLAAIPVVVALAWRLQHSKGNETLSSGSHIREWVALLAPLALVILLRNIWTNAEFFALGLVVLAFGMAKWQTIAKQVQAKRHWAMVPGSLVLAIALMSQAAIDQTVSDSSETKWVDVGVGGNYGKYQETCSGVHTFGNAGAGISSGHNWNGKHQVEFGVRAYYGNDTEVGSPDQIVLGGNPYVEYQNRWVGANLGAHLGNILTDGKARNFLPDLQLRLGPSDIFFVEGRTFNGGYAPIPGAFLRVGIGSGFGLKNGTVFRLGMSNMGIYFNPSIVVTKELMIEPMISIGDARAYQFGAGVRWRIDLKK